MRKKETGGERQREKVMKERCGVIHINVFVCLCACKLSGKIKTSPKKKKKRSQIDTRADIGRREETEKG